MRKKVLGKGLVVLLVMMMLFSVAIGSSGALASPNPERVRVFINFTTTPGPAEEALVRSFGGTVRHTYQIVPALSAELPQSAILALQRNPKVTLIEPVIKAYLVNYDSELNNTWGVKRIEAGSTHVDGHVGSGVKVAIVDTGIDYNHNDLNASKDKGDDFTDNSNDPMDVHSHGTHVAGTVAALRNGVGVVGAAPKAELYALKVFGDDGSADYADIVAAIDWAVQNEIQITNNSYGSAADPGDIVRAAFDNSYNAGVLHIAAAGNETWLFNRTNNVIYPAKFDSVMAISASDSNDKRASFSSNGPEVELIAPGVSINSTILNDQYSTKSGTSMASPHVAGVAALVWAVKPDLTNEQVRNILKETAEDLGLSASNQGYGLVRADLAVKAVDEVEPPPPSTYYNLTISSGTGGSVTAPGEGTFTYEEGTVIDLVAQAESGYQFFNWTGDTGTIADVNAASTTITMNGDYSITANFEEKPPATYYNLTISSGTGGSVTAPGEGIFTYEEGTVIDLVALAESDYQFVNWTGATDTIADVNAASTTITMNGDYTITANFELPEPPSDGIVSVESIEYDRSGGRNQDRHLHVTLTLKDNSDNPVPVSEASVSIELKKDGLIVLTSTGTTGADGKVTFSYNNHPSGTYTTEVIAVTAAGLIWDNETPPNTYTK